MVYFLTLGRDGQASARKFREKFRRKFEKGFWRGVWTKQAEWFMMYIGLSKSPNKPFEEGKCK